ncbi:MAG: hypothetical protein IMX04_00935 [Candidatus Carbobacillus altaicus]|uniref:Uncharacterized protein n=1 Tax=Candidatus Carbonibacillus altaicus TaxID=2163959 RepID=A0A2R6Y318_9BACL|nr:hypothetical protein [Candidatus Carbobacillus altaicus]PTQ57071.1 MAG: hypothetical protein BSOLF_2222 [Candidatus Carbobacillus altaicus]
MKKEMNRVTQKTKKKKRRNHPATALAFPLIAQDDATASAKENINLAQLALVASSFYAFAGMIGLYLAWKEWIRPQSQEKDELIVS